MIIRKGLFGALSGMNMVASGHLLQDVDGFVFFRDTELPFVS